MAELPTPVTSCFLICMAVQDISNMSEARVGKRFNSLSKEMRQTSARVDKKGKSVLQRLSELIGKDSGISRYLNLCFLPVFHSAALTFGFWSYM